MNWINAKDRLPKDGQIVLCYLVGVDHEYNNYSTNNFHVVCIFRTKDSVSENVPHFEYELCPKFTFHFQESKNYYQTHDIFWMQIEDIPKPEMK